MQYFYKKRCLSRPASPRHPHSVPRKTCGCAPSSIIVLATPQYETQSASGEENLHFASSTLDCIEKPNLWSAPMRRTRVWRHIIAASMARMYYYVHSSRFLRHSCCFSKVRCSATKHAVGHQQSSSLRHSPLSFLMCQIRHHWGLWKLMLELRHALRHISDRLRKRKKKRCTQKILVLNAFLSKRTL